MEFDTRMLVVFISSTYQVCLSISLPVSHTMEYTQTDLSKYNNCRGQRTFPPYVRGPIHT